MTGGSEDLCAIAGCPCVFSGELFNQLSAQVSVGHQCAVLSCLLVLGPLCSGQPGWCQVTVGMWEQSWKRGIGRHH